MRGTLDADAVERLGHHVDEFLQTRTRFITLDARDLTRAGASVIGLLGRTQTRLNRRSGMISVLGLHPTLLTLTPATPAATQEVVPIRRT